MKRVIFEKITLQNFLSVGEEPVSIEFRSGINIITGNNLDKPDRQNGIGKSTLADGINFAIFGETLRPLPKKDLIVNNIVGGTAAAQLSFKVETTTGSNTYKIVRTLNPNKVQFYENDVDITRDSIGNTTKHICSVLGASPSLFQNCVIMSVNNATSFMSKNKVEKRKFIEDIFGMEIFSKMTAVIRQEYLETKKEFDIGSARLEELSNTYDSYVQQQSKLEEKKKEKRELYISRKTTNENEIAEIEGLISNISIVDVSAADSTIDKLKLLDQRTEVEITTKVESIADVKSAVAHLREKCKEIGTKDSTCPVCLRPIEEHDKEVIEAEKQSLKQQIIEKADELKSSTDEVLELRKKRDKIRGAIEKTQQQVISNNLNQYRISTFNDRIFQLKKWLEELDEDLSHLDDNSYEFALLIESSKQQRDTVAESVGKQSKKLSKLDVVKFIVSEEGVKSYIVNKLLELLNSKLHFYLKKLDSNSQCIFNEYFEEEIVNEQGKNCSYFNFSGAERKAIDLACLFAFSDIRRLQGGVSYNIAIYDELFDSSFDSKGIEIVTDILQERADELSECIYVISHRKESLKAVTGDIIFLEKSGGITRRVNYTE
jgi:DNA repair exonuclease SbcCD ATPase subunit